MLERHFKLLIIFTLLSGVLLNYQNCASQKNALDGAIDTGSLHGGGNDLDVINPISVGGIQFIQTKTQVDQSDSDLTAQGLCSAEQNGALLSWKVHDQSDQLLAEGQSLCDKGTFKIVFEGVESLNCGAELSLKAFFGAKARTELLINKNCIQ